MQVKNAAGHWVDAPPLPGAFVCNIGDMFKVGQVTVLLQQLVLGSILSFFKSALYVFFRTSLSFWPDTIILNC